jgi:hypothetical protein
VASFFHYLDSRDVHHPFNCDLLGEYSISQYVTLGYDVAAIPLVNSIANHYMRPAHAALLFNDTAKLHKYCDTAIYHHFPIFQLFPSEKDGLVFRCNFRSLSFWFEFQIPSEQPIIFFNTNSKYLSVHNNNLMISVGNREFPLGCSRFNWYLVSLPCEQAAIVVVNGERRI